MDLSVEVHDVLTKMRSLNKEAEESISSSKTSIQQDVTDNIFIGDLININKINFSNDETWLYESPIKNSNVTNLKEWLYQNNTEQKDFKFHSNHLTLIREIATIEAKKGIDSRTFTRPKKRLNRPSIEMYNDGYFKMDKRLPLDSNKYAEELGNNTSIQNSNENIDLNRTIDITSSDTSDVVDNDVTAISRPKEPLNFDFSQPTTSSIFDKIIAAAPDVDSFQNMSPPSLVNSMCSSTFTNLMESSMIKNDPVLREIRDTDYSDDMLQDCDPPLLKSFTDSCSSLNSDTPEGFLKRTVDTTFNKIYKKNVSSEKENSLNETYTPENTVILNSTYQKNTISDGSSTNLSSTTETVVEPTICMKTKQNDINNSITSPMPILNGTYRKNMSVNLNDTFKKSPQFNSNDDLNRTVILSENVDSNRRNLSKRHSYIVDNRTCDLNQTVNVKRNSIGCSAGSTDSLDYMSSLSTSSRGSNKMLNMAEVDAIVLQQEQSLQQVMSTPKPASKTTNKLWENNCISPISALDRGDHMSDSEGSSNDDYLTVGSSTGSMRTTFGSETQVIKPNKSLEDFSQKTEILKPNPRSLNLIHSKMANNKRLDNNFGGSYTNLKTVGTNLKGSYTNLRQPSNITKGSYSNLTTNSSTKGSYTNLKTMSSNLKGSYTQLKPILTNLPCTDTNLKVFNPNPNVHIKQRSNAPPSKLSSNTIRIAEVAPTLREPVVRDQVKSNSAVNSARSQVKASGLPRPVSSIPRPMGSRIPGPRNLRPKNPHPSSKISMDCDF